MRSTVSACASGAHAVGEAFRLGGDEFALLLPEYDESEAVQTAGAIVERGKVTPGERATLLWTAGLQPRPKPNARPLVVLRTVKASGGKPNTSATLPRVVEGGVIALTETRYSFANHLWLPALPLVRRRPAAVRITRGEGGPGLRGLPAVAQAS